MHEGCLYTFWYSSSVLRTYHEPSGTPFNIMRQFCPSAWQPRLLARMHVTVKPSNGEGLESCRRKSKIPTATACCPVCRYAFPHSLLLLLRRPRHEHDQGRLWLPPCSGHTRIRSSTQLQTLRQAHTGQALTAARKVTTSSIAASSRGKPVNAVKPGCSKPDLAPHPTERWIY